MQTTEWILLVPLGTFWAAFTAISGACKIAHEQKEKIVKGDLPEPYRSITRADTQSLCVGVVVGVLVFTAILGWLAFALGCRHETGFKAAGFLVGLEAAFTGLTAYMFLQGTLRFFRKYLPQVLTDA